jgi:hypothetical protein
LSVPPVESRGDQRGRAVAHDRRVADAQNTLEAMGICRSHSFASLRFGRILRFCIRWLRLSFDFSRVSIDILHPLLDPSALVVTPAGKADPEDE